MCVDEALKEEVQKMSVRELKGYLNKHKVEHSYTLGDDETKVSWCRWITKGC